MPPKKEIAAKRTRASSSDKKKSTEKLASKKKRQEKPATKTTREKKQTDLSNESREYGTKKYWDDRYAAQVQDKENKLDITADWLFSYSDLAPLLVDATPKKKKADVLDVGCGTSPLLLDMHKDGWKKGKLCGIDISGIAEAKRMKCDAGPNIELKEISIVSACKHYGSQSFDLVIDKSTMDAMLCDGKKGLATFKRGVQQISSMLRYNGVFVLVSWRSIEEGGWLEHVINSLLEGQDAATSSFAIDAHHSTTSGKQQQLPWVYVFQKKKSKSPGISDVNVHEH